MEHDEYNHIYISERETDRQTDRQTETEAQREREMHLPQFSCFIFKYDDIVQNTQAVFKLFT